MTGRKGRLFALALAAVALLASAGRASAQSLVEGKWWKRPRIAAELQLTSAQAGELEKIFASTKPKLIDLRADLEKTQFAYDQAMQAENPDRKDLEAKITAREQARAALLKELSLMELDMKQVLTPAQRERLAQMRDRMKTFLRERRGRMRDGAGGDDYLDAPPSSAPSPPASKRPASR